MPAALLEEETIELVCEGLDTVASGSINNAAVGTATNMFVRYVFNVKSALKVSSLLDPLWIAQLVPY